MAEKLILRKKVETLKGNLYIFDREGKTVRVPESEAKKLIAQYPSEERNCKVSKGVVGMKANRGNLPVEHIRHREYKGVRIFTKAKYRDRCDILSNNAWFFKVKYNRDFILQHRDIVREIDNAKIIDDKLLTLQTPFGITSIDNLSTGTKTVLNVLYLLQYGDNKKLLVNVDECGDNALEYVFKAINNTRVGVYMTYIPMYWPDGYTYYVNGQLLKDVFEFYTFLECEVEEESL